MGIAPESGQQVERRRKRLLQIVAGVLVLVALGVLVTYRRRAGLGEKHLPDLRSLPANVNQRLSGYTFTRSDKGRPIFTIHAARTIAFKQGGTTVLSDVNVDIYGQQGSRHDTVRTGQCDYNPQTGELSAAGKVQIELNADAKPESAAAVSEDAHPVAGGVLPTGHQPLRLTTSQVKFTRQGSVVETDQPVDFQFGTAAGTARGMRYSTREGWVVLQNDVHARLAMTSARNALPVDLTAEAARYDKTTSQVTFQGPVEIEQGNRHVAAPEARAVLDARNRLTRIELSGGVGAYQKDPDGGWRAKAAGAVVEFDPDNAQLRSVTATGDVFMESRRSDRDMRLTSDKLTVDFAGAETRPQSGIAFGNVQLVGTSAKGATSAGNREPANPLTGYDEELRGNEVHFTFRQDRAVLSAAQTVGEGKLFLLPRDPNLGRRIATATPFEMSFDPQGRPVLVRGSTRPVLIFEPPPHSRDEPVAQCTADHLVAMLDPLAGGLKQVDQTGRFEFQQGDRQARADRARYEAGSDTLVLTGDPRVWDSVTRARADTIQLDMRTDTAFAQGHVQAVHFETGDPKTAPASPDPVNVVADRMRAERASQFVHYEGHVRAWRGQDVVESSSLDVFKNERRLSSGLRVTTSFLQPAAHVEPVADEKGARQETRPVVIRADRLGYFDEGKKASYRGHVKMVTQDTTLVADQLDVFFTSTSGPGASTVDRAVADGHVTVTQPGRRATGEHAEYFAAPGKIVLTGGPPVLYDADRGTTTGQRLTFFLRDDTLVLDGGKKSPTFSQHRIPQ